jgi:hypothetical protein
MSTATASEFAEQQECWCCGQLGEADALVHLGNHPEVAVCPRCAHSLSKWAWEVEDRSRTGPAKAARDGFRSVRRAVVHRGWHRSPLIGAPLRWLGRYLP